MSFPRAKRQQIIRAFAERNQGRFDAGLFLAEVERTGPEHPAYRWFDWHDARAAHRYRIEQAREFARGLTVVFSVEEARPEQRFRVSQREAPFVHSRLDGRARGGGYEITDPDNPEHMAELCRQAGQTLRWFSRRYAVAIERVGGDAAALEALARALEAPQLSVVAAE